MRHITAPLGGASVAALALAATVLFLLPGAAGAKTKLVELRVEGDGQTLDEGTWYAVRGQSVKQGRTPVCKRTRHRDKFEGANALTTLASAQESNRALKPVKARPTDFGPQVCRIGDLRSFGVYPNPNAGFLYYVNFESGFSSADLAKVRTGDSVLWHYSVFPSDPPQPSDPPTVNTGCALELSGVPARSDQVAVEVQVTAHGFGCGDVSTGVTFPGAQMSVPAGDGKYSLTLPIGTTEIYAEHAPDVRSNRFEVCVHPELEGCPVAHGRTIIGSGKRDKLRATAGDDVVRAAGGDDRINLKGGRDRVNCGKGDDVVRLKRGDGADKVRRNCERVRRS